MRHRHHRPEPAQPAQHLLRLAGQGIVAGRVVQGAGRAVPGQAQPPLQGVGGQVYQPAPEQGIRAHGRQGLQAGAAGDDAGVEGQVPEHLPDLAEQDGVPQHQPGVLGGLGVGVGREAAAQEGRRQHHPGAGGQQHVDGRHGHVAVQPLRAAAGEVEHRARHRPLRLEQQHLVRRAVRQQLGQGPGRHRRQGGAEQAHGVGPGRPLAGLERRRQRRAQALGGPARLQHHPAEQPVVAWGAAGQVVQGLPGGQGGLLVAPAGQDLPLQHRDRAAVDVHRAGLEALVADGAVVGHLLQPGQQLESGRALPLGIVQQRLHQRADRQVLVPGVEEQAPARVEHAAVGLALAAAHAVGDALGQLLQLAVFQDPRLQRQQVERGREDPRQRPQVLELARVHQPPGIDLPPVAVQLLDPGRLQVLELGDADAVLAGHHPAQGHHPGHDLVDDLVGPPEHGLVVGQHRHVHVHIAVPGVHVGGQDDAPVAGLLVGPVQRRQHPGEALGQARQGLADPVQQRQRAHRALPGLGQRGPGPIALLPGRQDLGIQLLAFVLGHGGLEAPLRQVQELDLRRPFLPQIDPVHEAGELRQRLQRDDDVLVELEGVGPPGDGAQALAVGPEAPRLVRVPGLEAHGVGEVVQHRPKPGGAHLGRFFRGAGHIDDHHRLGRIGPGGLHLVADGPHVLVVEMLQGQQGARLGRRLEGEGPGDLQDGLAGLVQVGAEELQAQGAPGRKGRVEDELGAGDHPVGALLLQPRQAAQGLVGDVLPQPLAADLVAAQGDPLQRRPGLVQHLEGDRVPGQDLAQPVVGPAHGPALAAGHGHGPGHQVVDAGAPAHRQLAPGILGDVAADRAGPGAGGVGGEHQPLALGIGHGLLRDDPGLQRQHRGAGQAAVLQLEGLLPDALDPVQLLGIDDHAAALQRHRPAREPGAGPPGDGLEPHPADGRQQRRHLLRRLRHGHRHRQGQAPVGGVGGVGHQGERVEQHVARPDHRAQIALQAPAQARGAVHLGPEAGQQLPAGVQDPEHQRIAARVRLDDRQFLAGILEEALAPAGRVQQFLEQVGVPAMDLQIAQEPHEQPSGTAGHPPVPERLQGLHQVRAQQHGHHLPVPGGGVVERDLPHRGGRFGECGVFHRRV